jgi:hypothetical protein
MKHADRDVRNSRISEALQEPVDAPDVTEFVMAHLPARPRTTFRWRWAHAAALLIIGLAVYAVLRPTQPSRIVRRAVPEHRDIVQQRRIPSPETVHESPMTSRNQSRPIRRSGWTRRTYVARNHTPAHPKHVEYPHAPDVQDVQAQPVRTAEEHLAADTVIVQQAVSHMNQTARALPPNPDADKIERPQLKAILNNGPERTPVTELGG